MLCSGEALWNRFRSNGGKKRKNANRRRSCGVGTSSSAATRNSDRRDTTSSNSTQASVGSRPSTVGTESSIGGASKLLFSYHDNPPDVNAKLSSTGSSTTKKWRRKGRKSHYESGSRLSVNSLVQSGPMTQYRSGSRDTRHLSHSVNNLDADEADGLSATGTAHGLATSWNDQDLTTSGGDESSVDMDCLLSPPNLPPGWMECPLCAIKQAPDVFPSLIMCSHRACYDCLYKYLKISILESRVLIMCPSCPEMIHPNDVYKLLADQPRILEKWEEFSVRRILMADPDTRWCPAPDCGFAVIATGCAGCPIIRCQREECATLFCYHCKQEWHPNQTCDEARYQRGSFTTSPVHVDMTIKPGDLKACPRCRTYIVKMQDGSCNHMVCAICGAEFCWLCMKEISDLHYLSPSGCTFWGKKPWSRKKKLVWQLGTLVGAPVGIALIAGLAVPAIIFGVPVWVGRKVHQRMKHSPKARRNIAIAGSVVVTVVLSPLLASLAVGVGVPIMLAYIYGVVPLSLCRNGTCGVSASSSGVNLDVDEDLLAASGGLESGNLDKSALLNDNDKHEASTITGFSMQSGPTQNRMQVHAEVVPKRRCSIESGANSLGDRVNYEAASTKGLAGSTYCDDKSMRDVEGASMYGCVDEGTSSNSGGGGRYNLSGGGSGVCPAAGFAAGRAGQVCCGTTACSKSCCAENASVLALAGSICGDNKSLRGGVGDNVHLVQVETHLQSVPDDASTRSLAGSLCCDRRSVRGYHDAVLASATSELPPPLPTMYSGAGLSECTTTTTPAVDDSSSTPCPVMIGSNNSSFPKAHLPLSGCLHGNPASSDRSTNNYCYSPEVYSTINTTAGWDHSQNVALLTNSVATTNATSATSVAFVIPVSSSQPASGDQHGHHQTALHSGSSVRFCTAETGVGHSNISGGKRAHNLRPSLSNCSSHGVIRSPIGASSVSLASDAGSSLVVASSNDQSLAAVVVGRCHNPSHNPELIKKCDPASVSVFETRLTDSKYDCKYRDSRCIELTNISVNDSKGTVRKFIMPKGTQSSRLLDSTPFVSPKDISIKQDYTYCPTTYCHCSVARSTAGSGNTDKGIGCCRPIVPISSTIGDDGPAAICAPSILAGMPSLLRPPILCSYIPANNEGLVQHPSSEVCLEKSCKPCKNLEQSNCFSSSSIANGEIPTNRRSARPNPNAGCHEFPTAIGGSTSFEVCDETACQSGARTGSPRRSSLVTPQFPTLDQQPFANDNRKYDSKLTSSSKSSVMSAADRIPLTFACKRRTSATASSISWVIGDEEMANEGSRRGSDGVSRRSAPESQGQRSVSHRMRRDRPNSTPLNVALCEDCARALGEGCNPILYSGTSGPLHPSMTFYCPSLAAATAGTAHSGNKVSHYNLCGFAVEHANHEELEHRHAASPASFLPLAKSARLGQCLYSTHHCLAPGKNSHPYFQHHNELAPIAASVAAALTSSGVPGTAASSQSCPEANKAAGVTCNATTTANNFVLNFERTGNLKSLGVPESSYDGVDAGASSARCGDRIRDTAGCMCCPTLLESDEKAESSHKQPAFCGSSDQNTKQLGEIGCDLKCGCSWNSKSIFSQTGNFAGNEINCGMDDSECRMSGGDAAVGDSFENKSTGAAMSIGGHNTNLLGVDAVFRDGSASSGSDASSGKYQTPSPLDGFSLADHSSDGGVRAKSNSRPNVNTEQNVDASNSDHVAPNAQDLQHPYQSYGHYYMSSGEEEVMELLESENEDSESSSKKSRSAVAMTGDRYSLIGSSGGVGSYGNSDAGGRSSLNSYYGNTSTVASCASKLRRESSNILSSASSRIRKSLSVSAILLHNESEEEEDDSDCDDLKNIADASSAAYDAHFAHGLDRISNYSGQFMNPGDTVINSDRFLDEPIRSVTPLATISGEPIPKGVAVSAEGASERLCGILNLGDEQSAATFPDNHRVSGHASDHHVEFLDELVGTDSGVPELWNAESYDGGARTSFSHCASNNPLGNDLGGQRVNARTTVGTSHSSNSYGPLGSLSVNAYSRPYSSVFASGASGTMGSREPVPHLLHSIHEETRLSGGERKSVSDVRDAVKSTAVVERGGTAKEHRVIVEQVGRSSGRSSRVTKLVPFNRELRPLSRKSSPNISAFRRPGTKSSKSEDNFSFSDASYSSTCAQGGCSESINEGCHGSFLAHSRAGANSEEAICVPRATPKIVNRGAIHRAFGVSRGRMGAASGSGTGAGGVRRNSQPTNRVPRVFTFSRIPRSSKSYSSLPDIEDARDFLNYGLSRLSTLFR